MSTVAPQPDSSPRKRRWYQFIRRMLLGFVLLAIIGACDAAVRIHSFVRQREAVEAIEKLGGSADYYYDSIWLPWTPVFGKVGRVNLDGVKVTDAGLKSLMPHLKKLPYLIQLSLNNTQITDAALERLGELTQLQFLSLAVNHITDAGLIHIERLTQLKELTLVNTRITDAGLEHLKGLSNLQFICLWQTQVTDEGVRKLQRALPRCKIGRR